MPLPFDVEYRRGLHFVGAEILKCLQHAGEILPLLPRRALAVIPNEVEQRPLRPVEEIAVRGPIILKRLFIGFYRQDAGALRG